MAINELKVWKNELNKLPKVSTLIWAANFSNWYFDMIANIEPDKDIFNSVGYFFLFPVPVFTSLLIPLPPTTDNISGILGFSSAWESSILATKIVISPGSSSLPTTPSTTFSIVFSSLIDAQSILEGKKKILELVNSSPSGDSEFPIKFREATKCLTFTVIGLDSTPPPVGPLPLTISSIPFI